MEAENDELMSKVDTYIQTVPGIGSVTGAVILGEIGDIEGFDNPSKLVAYTALDSSVSQSGQQESVSGRLSKRAAAHTFVKRCIRPLYGLSSVIRDSMHITKGNAVKESIIWWQRRRGQKTLSYHFCDPEKQHAL